ncbi:dipeptide/oligopeptide/nickel ABC transporter permease/ATP-binding protein [Streptomyces blattellae]|uniref:dipeptide/oligopeptide/nickel ABC transporter permease/ATP-binding protein n=1 Tax=Streptomyces blattellae TaxID=2569855 RepID=UPI0012B9AAFE|nr:dipeptide/oligopeptide/nickel ABC transporter permease/ATP-binding protein [Streptomyces blattellae]
MSESLSASLETPATAAAPKGLFRRLLKNPLGAASLGVLTLIVLTALLAPVLAPHDPDAASANDILASPSSNFLLGADGSGHDILSRLLYASRVSLAGAALALAVAAALGVTAGLVSGYYGRWFETASTWVTNLLMALPGVVALLAVRAAVGPSLWTTMAIFGVLLSPAFYRVVYTAVSGVRNELYVDAARVSGLRDPRIISRHILIVVRAPAIILAASIGSVAIAIQSGITFLGLGDPSVPTWGGMLNDAFANMYTAPLQLTWPSLAIGLTAISLTLLSNALRDELERSSRPKRRRGRRDAGTATVRHEPVLVHEDTEDTEDAPSGEILLDVQGLTVSYDQADGSAKTVVEDVSLTVRRGEVHGLIGESGSGKTQTAFAIMRLMPPGGQVAGSILFEGADLARLSAKEMTRLRGKKIAYIPQEPMSNIDPSFSIGSQLVEPMRVQLGLSKAEARDRALRLLARVGIPDPERTFNAYPHEVSGGMAQRVLIAGAVSCDPDLLIADEPTTALDVTVQAEVLDLLRDLQSDLNMGVILVTHNFGVVADLCDRVSVMRGGRIVETGAVQSIFDDPRHSYTQSLFEAILDDSRPRGPLETDVTAAASTQGASS